MPTLQEIQALRAERAELDARLYRTRVELQKLRAALAGPDAGQVIETIRARDAERARLEGALGKVRGGLHAAVDGLFESPHPADGVAALDDAVPFLLLPLRLETRFVDANDGRELWLRVYPDDVAIRTHEETLTDAEVAAGEAYWRALLAATKNGGDGAEAARRAAWSDLVVAYPPQRAAWVALRTKPANWSDDLADVADADALDFPAHDLTKTDAWSRAPRTDVMPDRLVVLLYEGGKLVREVVGPVIPDELFVGPDPFDAEQAFRTADTKLVFGEAYDWTSNFDRAVEKGLGFRIPLAGAQAASGFDRVIVLGALLSADETESQRMVERLIDNHHYSPAGFSVVPQGTPTNNTERDGSGYTRNDPLGETSYVVEAGPPLFGPTDDCDGRALADALGIDYAPLQHVMHADGRDGREAVAMNTALYPGTLGYYFGTLLSPVLGRDAQDAVRDFFVRHVTGRGPLPAVRVGDQPYGVLLTSDFSRWQERERAPLLRVLRAYDALWSEMVGQLAFVGKPGVDPGAALLDVLGLQAGSVEFHQRNAYSTDDLIGRADFTAGGRWVDDLRASFTSKGAVMQFVESLGGGFTGEDGDAHVPQLLRLVYHHRASTLDAANLIDGVPLSESRPVRDTAGGKNYLRWLADAADAGTLERQDFGPGVTPPNALLYLMLRKALLEQLHNAAARWMDDRGVTAGTLGARNFMNVRPEPSLSKWEVMKAPVRAIDPASPLAHLTVAELLLGHTSPAEGAFLTAVRSAVAELATVPTARLERCFTEHLDACSYRLDAWQTGLFDARLRARRGLAGGAREQRRRQGIRLGAYGWLEHVRPSAERRRVREPVHPKLQPPNGAPLFEDADNGGFVHAPSLNQATAAAVLRAGYMAHATPTNPDVMAVNLSSERVRRALAILQGVRQGQPMEALLGYQFERGLHDRASADPSLDLNLHIYAFREQFPYEQHRVKQQGDPDASYAPQVTVAASNVVNGVKLAEATGAEVDAFLNGIAGLTAAERAAILDERDRLADSLDAVKDLLLSESVYQLVQGNVDRTAAAANALQEARVPADIQVVDMPRSSQFGFTNRVTLHFDPLDPALAASNPWAPVAMTPRARMEPGANAWLGAILGAPSAIVCNVGRRAADGTLSDVRTVRADALAVQPIDLVYMAGTELNTGESEAGKESRTAVSEIESRVAFAYRQANAVPDAVPVGIEFLEPAATPGTTTLGALLPLLRTLRALLVESRPLHAGDYDPPARTSAADPANPKGYDAAELQARVNAARTAVAALRSALGNVALSAQVTQADGSVVVAATLADAVAALDAADAAFDDGPLAIAPGAVAALQQQLRAAADHGLAYAFPSVVAPATDAERATLLEQARSVFHRLGAALDDSATSIAGVAAGASVGQVVAAYVAAAKALFGEAFAVIPLFAYSDDAGLLASHADEAQLLAHARDAIGMTFPADEWLQNAAHVRPKLARWDAVRALHEARNGATLALHPVQLPFRPRDSWVAVAFPDTYETVDDDGNPKLVPFALQGDTLCATVHGAGAFVPGARQGGLLIDDWAETVPAAEETTGIAFHYNQPNAMPPQALLLAVSPTLTGRWSWQGLVGVVEDTLRRAKLRAVEPALLDRQDRPELAVLLPAVLSSFSQYDLDIALDYRLNVADVYLASPVQTALSRGA